jgi:hypothetical protein
MSKKEMTQADLKRLLQKAPHVHILGEARPATTPVKEQKKRSPRTQAQEDVHLINHEVKCLLTRLQPLCGKIGCAYAPIRAFTTDPRDQRYVNISDHYATPNAIDVWRDPRRAILGFLWEFPAWTDEQIVQRLHDLFDR